MRPNLVKCEIKAANSQSMQNTGSGNGLDQIHS